MSSGKVSARVSIYTNHMLLVIIEAHKAAHGIEHNSVGQSLKFEIAYKIIYDHVSQIPFDKRQTVYDEVTLLLNRQDFKGDSLVSFIQWFPVWMEFTKQAMESETLQTDEKSILRRYIKMRQIWRLHNKDDYAGVNFVDFTIKPKMSILDKPVDTTNIYPGNPTRRTGSASNVARTMANLFLRHILSRTSALTSRHIQCVVHQGLGDIFGTSMMFAVVCENQWTTLVLCLARTLFDIMLIKDPSQREGAQSLAISFTILLNAYYPIDTECLNQILAIVPESLRDLSDLAVIDRYYHDIFDRFDVGVKQKGSWFHKSYPVQKEIFQYYREFILEGIKMSAKYVKQECLALGPDLGYAFSRFMNKVHDNNHLFREVESHLLEAFVDEDAAINAAAKKFEYWAAFKAAWIQICIGCGAVGHQRIQYIQAYENLRGVIVACRESFGKYPIRSSITLDEIRSSKYLSDFEPESLRPIQKFTIILDIPIYTGEGSFTTKRTLEKILPAYEYVVNILSLLHPSAKTVDISKIDIYSQTDKIDWYVMDVLFVQSTVGPEIDQARAFSRILYELIIELFGKKTHALALRLRAISCMLLTQIYRFVHERKENELENCVSLLQQLWYLLNWKGHIVISHKGVQIAEIDSADSIRSSVTL